MDIASLGYEIDSSQLVTASGRLDKMAGAAGKVESASARMDRQHAKTEKALASLSGGVDRTAAKVLNLAGALISIQTVRSIVNMADTWSDITSRVRLSIDAHENAADVMKRLSVVARQTYSSFETTAEGFTRNATTLNALGKSTQQQLDYTQALNNAMVVSGAKGEHAAQVQDNLAKAMATGGLRGQELETILNRGSRVAELLAEELGVNVTELRAIAAEGKITGEVIFNALVKNMEKLTEEAESMPATMGDAFVLIQNALLELVGTTDQAGSTSQYLAENLIMIADAISIIAPQVAALAASWREQATEQGNVTTSAVEIAHAMKVVVTGLLLAKNAVDVLVAGFQFMVKIAISAGAEIIGQFGVVADALPKIWEALKDPGNIGDNIAQIFAGVLAEAGTRLDRFNAEAMEGSKEFGEVLTQTNLDVSNAFGFLEGANVKAELAIAATEDRLTTFAPAVTRTQEEVDKLARAESSLADMIGRVTGAISPLDKVMQEYEKTKRDLLAIEAKIIKLGGDEAKVTKLVAAAIAQAAKNRDAEVAEITAKQGAVSKLIADMETELGLILMDEQARNSAVAAMQAEKAMIDAIATARENGAEISEKQARANIENARTLAVEAEEAARLERILGQYEDITFGNLLTNIDEIRNALETATDPDLIARLTKALGGANQAALSFAVDAVGAGISNLQTLADEGSKAYKALEVAQAANNLVAAIGAIVNQGMGDPYTAFARMAAMAAAVGQLVGSIGSFSASGPSASSAAARQNLQGTGTILGDSEAKSESILNATEITADATAKLVGINQGMLRALNAMEAAIGGASGLLARGAAGAADTSLATGGSGLLPSLSGTNASLFNAAFANIFGGKESLRDQGVLIVGGALSDMIDDIMVQSYATIHRSGGWFSSSRNYDRTADIGDEVAVQFQLVLDSMADAVREGARALGLNMDEVNAAIDAYQIEEIRISTMDLSAEEAQAELEAVFSSIFDGLAGSVVPFIRQFQNVGEGLGETLVRVATSVQVVQEAMTQLGLAIDVTDPEQFAQISVGLIDMAGGLDAFITGMQTFVNAFGTEEHKFAVAQDAITRAFEQFGLTIPDTREGMWSLMQSLDATTVAGQEQIAMLLRIAGTADSYYSMLESRQDEATQAAERAAQAAADATAESQRVVGDLLARIMGQVADGQHAIDQFDMSPLAIQLAQIERETAQDLAAAAANGASDVVQMTIAMTGMERAIIATRLAALDFNEQLSGWEFEDALTGMTELQQQIAQSDRVWQERLAQAIEIFGAESEEAARVTLLWGNATTRFTDAAIEAAQSLIAYTGNLVSARRSVQQILQEARIGVRGDGLTDQQRAIREINDRFNAYEQGLRDSIIGFSGSATARRLLEEQINAGLIELAELRLEALTNLELEWLADITAATLERYQTELDAIRHIQDYLDGMLLGADSPLSAEERTAEAWNQLQAAVAAGDAQEATRLADVYLRLLREGQASGDDFNAQWHAVRALLEGMRDGLVESITNDATIQYLADIAAGGVLQLHALDRMTAAMLAIADALGTDPDAAAPTNVVAASGYVVSAPAAAPESEGVRVLEAQLGAVVAELTALRADVRSGTGNVAAAVTTSAKESDKNRDASLGRHMRPAGRMNP